MRAHLTCLLLALLCAPAAPAQAGAPAVEPTATVPDALTAVVEQDFLSCGQSARPDPALNEAARLVLRGFKLAQATAQVGYRAKRGGAELLTGTITAPKLAAALANKCGQRLGYSRYGVATDQGRFALVYAEPAQVDLTRRTAWLEEFLHLTNQARYRGHRCGDTLFASTGPLTWNEPLGRAASAHAAQLVRLNFRGHLAPDSAEGPMERARAAGFPGPSVGETIAYESLTPEEALQGLLASPGHCRIIMNPEWTVMGADVVNGEPGSAFSTYWVQVFGRP